MPNSYTLLELPKVCAYLSVCRFSLTANVDHEGGFGNIMQETLLNAYLAHQSKRA